MRYALVIILIIAGSNAGDTIGRYTPHTTFNTDSYGNAIVVNQRLNHPYRSETGSGTPVYHYTDDRRIGSATGNLTLSRITIVKDDRTYNLLGKETTIQQKASLKKRRKWHEQVINLFR